MQKKAQNMPAPFHFAQEHPGKGLPGWPAASGTWDALSLRRISSVRFPAELPTIPPTFHSNNQAPACAFSNRRSAYTYLLKKLSLKRDALLFIWLEYGFLMDLLYSLLAFPSRRSYSAAGAVYIFPASCYTDFSLIDRV